MDTNSNNSSNKASLEEAQHLQMIERNPLSAEDVAMFEMFKRKEWPAERRRAYIIEKFRKFGKTTAAE